MEEHHLPVSRAARYYTLGDPAGASDFWFVCHGYGQLAARFARHFEPIVRPTRLVVAPEGLSRFYLSERPSERRVGASWMTREDRLAEIADYVRYWDALCGAVAGGGRVTLLGFSQGAATACRWAALGAAPVHRLILWGGEVPPDLDLAREPGAARLRAAGVTLVYGTRDELFPAKVVAANEERLAAHGIPHHTVSYDGGHEIAPDVLRRLAAG